MATLKKKDKSNSVLFTLYSKEQTTRLCGVKKLTVPSEKGFVHVEVEMVLLRSNEQTSRGVITVEEGESDSQIMNELYNERITILDVKRMGKSNRAVVTFATPKLPRVVRYHYELIKVSPYKPRTLICYNCHQSGHMLRHCPNPGVCKSCGKKHDIIDNADCEERSFCAVCKETGHLATSPLCPSRLKDKKPLNPPDKEGRKQGSSATRGRSRSRTRRNTIDEDQSKTSHPENATCRWSGVVAGISANPAYSERRIIELQGIIDQAQMAIDQARAEIKQLTQSQPEHSKNRPRSSSTVATTDHVQIVAPETHQRKPDPTLRSATPPQAQQPVTQSDLVQAKAQVVDNATKEAQKEVRALSARLENRHQMQKSESAITAQRLDQIEKRLAKIDAIETSVGELTTMYQNVMAQLNSITLTLRNKDNQRCRSRSPVQSREGCQSHQLDMIPPNQHGP